MKALFLELLKREEPVITAEEIYDLFPELNENAVQAKIKRCLKTGELVRLYKGVYTLNSEFRKKPILEEQVAHAIDENAFLSGLGALRFHNLIPEIVKFKTFFGTKEVLVNAGSIHFQIKRVREDLTQFGVDEVHMAGESIRVADPVRALMDALLTQNLTPKTRDQICAFFRIEDEDAENIDWKKAFNYAENFRSPAAHRLAESMNTRELA